MDQQQLGNLSDACRPGGKDLRQPELMALADRLARDPVARGHFERSQRLDAALGAAFRDAPVPPGLETRLLAAVGAQAMAPLAAQEAAPAAAGEPSVERRPRVVTRRSVGAAIAASLALVTLGGLSYWHLAEEEEVTRPQLMAQAQDWLNDRDFDNPSAWAPVTRQDLQAFPSQFLTVAPTQARRIATDLDRRATVYRLPLRNGQSAYLFALRGSAAPGAVGAAPPRAPFPEASGGWKMGAWTAEGTLYVLATESDYRGLIRRRPTV